MELDTTFYTIATFQATRIQLSHSVETRKKNVLEISVMTRYWNILQNQVMPFLLIECRLVSDLNMGLQIG